MDKLQPNHLIYVCDKCLCASCWHGELMCDYAQTAGETIKTVSELRRLTTFEHESHWKHQEEVTGNPLQIKTDGETGKTGN